MSEKPHSHPFGKDINNSQIESLKNIEKAAYARGYNAGLKKKSKLEIDAEKLAAKTAFRHQVYTAVLTGLVSGSNNWGKTVDGKHEKYYTIEDYTQLANSIAVKSLIYF